MPRSDVVFRNTDGTYSSWDGQVKNLVYDSGLLMWVAQTQSSGSGGGLTDAELRASPVSVSLASVPLATGAATAAKQDTGNTSLAGIDSTGAKDSSLSTINTSINTLLKPANTLTAVTTVTTVSAVTAITNALPAGTNLLGKVSIDQTTPGTTNKVSIGTDGTVAINTALPAGANAIGKLAANAGVTIGAVEIASAQTLATVTTVSTVTNLSQLGGAAIAMNTGVRTAGTQRVTIATDDLVPITGTVTASIAASATTIAKAEDAASADADVGVPTLAVRKAIPANTSGTDGDYEFLQMSAGRLWVDASGVTLTVGSHAVTNAGTFAVQAAITAASGSIASGAVASGAVASGAFASGSISAGAIAAGASSFVKLEDAASADADAGVACLAVRKATPANTSGADGDYEFLQISAGRLWASATIDAALPAGTNGIGKLTANAGVTIGAVEIAAAQTLATVTTVSAVTAITNALPAGANVIGGSIPSPSSSSSFAPTRAVSTAYEASRVVKASAGNLYRLWGYNSKTTAQFIQIHNTTSVPADTAVPILFMTVPGSSNFNFDFLVLPEQFATGISVCNSSTGPTKTIGSADCWFFASYQ